MDNEVIRKAKMISQVLSAVPDDSVWGIQEVMDDIWKDFNQEWNSNIKPFLIDCDRSFAWCYPDIYILLTSKVKRNLINIISKYPNSIDYYWHNVIFKEEKIFMFITENNLCMDLSEDLLIDITDNEDWVYIVPKGESFFTQ